MAELTVDAAAMAAMAAAPLASMPEEAALQHMYAAPLMQSALQPNHLTANARRKPAKFVVQLYKMICEDPDPNCFDHNFLKSTNFKIFS